MRINWIFLLCLISLVACKERTDEEVITTVPPISENTLVNWSFMNDSGWKNLSFPLWFNSEEIDSLDISTIEMSFSSFQTTDTIIVSTDTLPYQVLQFNFAKNGNLKEMIWKEFDTGINIEENRISYTKEPDDFGYSLPNITTTSSYRKDNQIAWVDLLQDLQQYKRLELVESDSSFLKYIDRNDVHKEEHYFILNKAYWNVTYIDQNIQSTNKKLFYYGSPINYISAFSVENLVEKTKHEGKTYFENKVLKNQSFYTQDFITKRSYDYDSTGLCVGFNDSLTTNDQQFIHLTNAVINYNELKPKEIVFYNEEDDLQEHPIRHIRFKYN